MLLDSLGKRPSDYRTIKPRGRCPECGCVLIGVMPSKIIEHWRHDDGDHTGCMASVWSGGETEWHRQMKIAFLEQGCEVEKTIDIDGKKYRADAMHGKTVFEFANTISKSYEKKTVDLLAAGYRVVWVLNSTANVSYSETTVFLKGAMYNLANVMEHLGSEVWLHVCGQLVKVDHEKFYKSYGIKNAFRFLRFITRGHGFWPWDQIENNGNNDDFFTDDLSNTIPICYNAQDCAEVKL